MENDMIRRSDVLDLATKGYFVSNSNYGSVKRIIRQLPAVDAVEVVRCNNCKFGIPRGSRFQGERVATVFCTKFATPKLVNWYCASGKRREDGDGDG